MDKKKSIEEELREEEDRHDWEAHMDPTKSFCPFHTRSVVPLCSIKDEEDGDGPDFP